MILKTSNSNKSFYNTLDLLGNGETALSKAFAYLLSIDRDCYFCFLHYLGISLKNTPENYKSVKVTIEHHREEGRTDIEFIDKNNYHVIIECKIGKGKVVKQRVQYLNSFDQSVKKKIFCILTQERDTNKQIDNDVIIRNTSWFDIIQLFNHKDFIKKQIVNDFLNFTTKNYKMKELKEILIQDIQDVNEIIRFQKYNVYRRKQTFGTPLYFAPYFTKKSNEKEGISNLSKILGILTLKSIDINNYNADINSFSKDDNVVNNWISGVQFNNTSDLNTIYTYYFLDEPYRFNNSLIKDGGKKPGRGKNWIASHIPPNRCVSFIDFIKHIPELK